MAKKSNPKLIGAFVVGAIALVCVGVLAFGGGEFLKTKERAVVFFEGSLAGLDVGAPVTFRGIKVGVVTAIVIKYDVEKQELHVPVYIEIQPEKIEIVSGQRNIHNLAVLVERGLRGQLVVQSLVTGQVTVDFDFHPEIPIRLVGLEPGIPELPTEPSDIEVLKANVTSLLGKLNKLPLESMADAAIGVLKTADGMLKDLDAQVKPLVESLESTSDQADRLLVNLDAQVKPLLDSLKGTSDQAGRLLTHADADLPQLMKSATGALNQAERTLRTAQEAIAPDSPLFFQANATLRELKAAAASVNSLADYLERNPNALLVGKK